MHYLPNLRKILTTKKKEKPARVKLHQPLDFHAHTGRSSGTAVAAEQPNPHAHPGNQLRPQPPQLIRQRTSAGVATDHGQRSWVQGIPWRRTMCVALAAALILSTCALSLFLAWHGEVMKPVCDETCMKYTTLLGESMDWSVGPCQDFYRFVCGGAASNQTSVRNRINERFLATVIETARNEEIPAESQTVAQKAARLFKTCDDVLTQDTDYVPRIRGHLREVNLHWPQHPANRDAASVDVVSTMLELNDKWGWPCFFEFEAEKVGDYSLEAQCLLEDPAFQQAQVVLS
ncbi:hypothetical protein MRX96_009383 [Rhipicephalus microplus]